MPHEDMVDDLLVVPTRLFDHAGFLVAPLTKAAFAMLWRAPFAGQQFSLYLPGFSVHIAEGPFYFRPILFVVGGLEDRVFYFLVIRHSLKKAVKTFHVSEVSFLIPSAAVGGFRLLAAPLIRIIFTMR